MHKATYHENELLDMARATENRATRLRKAIEHNRLVREQSRAGSAPEPEPAAEPEPVGCSPLLRNIGMYRTALGAVAGMTSAPEQEPPSVEVDGMAQHWRYTRITSFSHEATGRWRVYGDCINEAGRAYPNTYNCTTATPFAIWQECIAAGVPCCDPPYADLTLNIGDRWRVFSIMELRVSPHTGNSFIRCIGNRPDYGARYAVENTYYVTESPAAIRAACAEKGVPCPEEEKPKTVTVAHGAGTMRFDRLTTIAARLTLDNKPGLFVTGTVGATEGATFTTTPIADIRKQAAEAGSELPEVTVNIDSYRWTAIERADCHVCDDGSLLTDIIGVAEQYGEHTIHTSTLTPAQVVVLCELAGWPKPEVTMVCTYADGDPCEVDPENIFGVGVARHATTIETNTPLADGRCVHHVREPVAVVEQMLAACGDPVPAVAGE